MPRGSKNHKGIAKRFKVTKKGKVIGKKCGYHHKQVKKSSNRTRHARLGIQVKGSLRKSFLNLLSN
jgi:large subunit ribosomal protein L35